MLNALVRVETRGAKKELFGATATGVDAAEIVRLPGTEGSAWANKFRDQFSSPSKLAPLAARILKAVSQDRFTFDTC